MECSLLEIEPDGADVPRLIGHRGSGAEEQDLRIEPTLTTLQSNISSCKLLIDQIHQQKTGKMYHRIYKKSACSFNVQEVMNIYPITSVTDYTSN